ncbi:28676_t:CDS:1, partial [Racocetra persica]
MPPSPKTPPHEILSICKKYFIIGFFFLPWLWVINVVYMWPLIKREDI